MYVCIYVCMYVYMYSADQLVDILSECFCLLGVCSNYLHSDRVVRSAIIIYSHSNTAHS